MISPNEAYDDKGNLKAGLTMMEDGRIYTHTRGEERQQKLDEAAARKKKQQAHKRAQAWGEKLGDKLGISDWKVFERDQPAWLAKLEDMAINTGLFGKEGMIILAPKEGEEGQEIEYNGYKTQNFHICPGAISTFTNIKKMGLRGKEQQVMTGVVEMVDSMLGLEVVMKEHGGDSEDLYLMISLSNKVFYVLGRLWGMTEVDFLNGFKFMTDHICTAASIVYGGGDKQELSKHDDGIDVGNMPSSKGEIVIAEAKEVPEYPGGGTMKIKNQKKYTGGNSALPLGPIGGLFAFGKLLHKKQVGQKSMKHQRSTRFRGRKAKGGARINK